MAKSVAEIMKEAEKNRSNPMNPTNPKNPVKSADETLKEAQGRIQFLETQTKVLQEQLQQRSTESEERKLEQEVERLRKEEETLREETNLQKILDQALLSERSANQQDRNNLESENLSQKDLVSLIADAVGKATEATAKLTMKEVEKKLTDSNKQIGGLQKVMIELLSGMSVNQARSKHKDFDVFAEDAAKIHTANPTLTPEQAYLLAKAQKASSLPDKSMIETERPTDVPYSASSRSSESSEESGSRSNEPVNPRAAFRSAVSNAIDKVLASRQT